MSEKKDYEDNINSCRVLLENPYTGKSYESCKEQIDAENVCKNTLDINGTNYSSCQDKKTKENSLINKMHINSNRICSRKINSPYKIVVFDKKSDNVTKETADHIVNNLKLEL